MKKQRAVRGYPIDEDDSGWIVSFTDGQQRFLFYAHDDVIGDTDSVFEATVFPTKDLAETAISLHRSARGTGQTRYKTNPADLPPTRLLLAS